MRNHCPNDELLMDFVEGRLSDRQRNEIEVHLAACAPCREQVGVCAAVVYGTAAADEAHVPDHLTERALERVARQVPSPGPGVIDRARRWVAKGVAVLERIVPQGEPAWVAVRGEATVSDQLIRREKRFEDAAFTIEIEKSGDKQALIRVTSIQDNPSEETLRVALFKGEREAASMMLGDMPAVFEEIAFGVYTLVFARGNTKIGEYTFEVTERSKTE
jgi:hypothetical protein